MGINIAALKARRSQAQGFTLVELMVVVAIIGILAAIVTLNFAHAKSNAEVSATEANLKEIAAALEVYYSDNQTYPATGAVTPALLTVGTTTYLSTTPVSPGPIAANAGAGANNYLYTNGAPAAGAQATNSYVIEDPAIYDQASLANLPSSTAKGATQPTAKCGIAGGCLYVGYSNVIGMFGEPGL